MPDQVGTVFAALSDPTRRAMIGRMLDEGVASVPSLRAAFPMSRQAVAKHLAALDGAGLVERVDGPGREVRYRLADGALDPAAAWMRDAERSWDRRLASLKRSVE